MTAQRSSLKNPALLGLAFALVGVVISALLVCKHMFPEVCQSAMGCSVQGGVDGCKELGQSRHSKLFGIPIALFGLFYYAFLSMLMWRLSRVTEETRDGMVNLVLAVIAFGFVADLGLAYKNFFVLLYPCLLCAYTYVAQLGVVGAAVWVYLANGKELGTGRDLGVGLRAAIIPLASAVIIAIGIPLVLAGLGGSADPHAGHNHAHGHGHGTTQGAYGVPLLPADRASGRVQELKAFKAAGFGSRGLTNSEGESGAYIQIHKFADFNCGHCYNASLVLREAQKRWPGRVVVHYRHFPLDGTCNSEVRRRQPGGWSCNGAMAALCAPQQNIFSTVYHGIFDFQRKQQQITPQNLQQLVEASGGNWSRMAACMGSPATARALRRDIDDALSIKVESTPTIVLEGHVLPPGTPDVTYFFQTLDALVYAKEGKAGYTDFETRLSKATK